MAYEVVIGLETHVHLLTESKLFCGCPLEFGRTPNSQTCPICLGMPGVLPVMNRRAVDYVLKIALALNCDIPDFVNFDRKSYYYPDLPKNYQISQNYHNVGTDGRVDLEVNGQPRPVRIHNVHLEEDAGKLMHPADTGLEATLVDLNRAGTPMAEIVTQPDLRSVDEAEAYMHTLIDILLYLDVSDCRMQEGSLRFEASISLRPFGQEAYGNRVEIKNLNSMKAVVKSLTYEVERQTRALEAGRTIRQETRLWDEVRGRTALMRRKEEAMDYRYFPEPDLVPLTIDQGRLQRLRAELPELAHPRRRRFIHDYELPEYDAGVLTAERPLADYFEAVAEQVGSPKLASHWVMGEVLRFLNDEKITIEQLKVTADRLSELIQMVESKKITRQVGQKVFLHIAASGEPAPAIVEREGLGQIEDAGALETVVDRVLAENEKALADYRQGKASAFKFLLGQIMRQTRGQANPQVASELLQRKLDS